jgi:hypothetical protein
LDNPLHVILNKSKLAYRIYVILIANKELIKKIIGSAGGQMGQRWHQTSRWICTYSMETGIRIGNEKLIFFYMRESYQQLTG